MTFGELCFVENPTLDLEATVLQAASDYLKKYGERPTLVLVHPSLLQGAERHMGGLRLEAKATVLPNYVWIGMGEKAEIMPVAQ